MIRLYLALWLLMAGESIYLGAFQTQAACEVVKAEFVGKLPDGKLNRQPLECRERDR